MRWRMENDGEAGGRKERAEDIRRMQGEEG